MIFKIKVNNKGKPTTMITINTYYAVSEYIYKRMQQMNTLGITKSICLEMAQSLCEYCQVPYEDFISSTNGIRICGEGIDDSYTVALYPTMKMAIANFTNSGYTQTYSKVIQWIARRTKRAYQEVYDLCKEYNLKYIGVYEDCYVLEVALPTSHIPDIHTIQSGKPCNVKSGLDYMAVVKRAIHAS